MYAWNDVFGLPYESAWSIFQKLTWLNETSKPLVFMRDVSSQYFNPSEYNYCPSYYGHTFIDTSWLICGRPRTASLPPVTAAGLKIQELLLRHGGQSYVGSFAKRFLRSNLHVCPACIGLGFHCIAHQLAGIGKCPVHGVELTNDCPQCGKTLGDFEPRAKIYAFKCPHCCKSLLDEDELYPRNIALEQSVFDRIQPLIAWVNSFADESISWPSNIDVLTRVAYQDPDVVVNFRDTWLSCFHQIRPFDGGEEWFMPKAAGLSLVSVDDAEGVDVWGPSGREIPRYRMANKVQEILGFVHNIIAEELRTIAKRIDQHGSCCEKMDILLSPYVNSHDEYFVSPSADYCGVAQAFHLWERRLKRGIEELEYSVRSGWTPCLNDAFERIVRMDVISAFYMSAQTVGFHQHEEDSSLSLWYAAYPHGKHPFWSLNGERTEWSMRKKPVSPLLVFRLDDADVLAQLRCDGGKMVQRKIARHAHLVNEMRSRRSCQ